MGYLPETQHERNGSVELSFHHHEIMEDALDLILSVVRRHLGLSANLCPKFLTKILH